jgi:hypothetical protein
MMRKLVVSMGILTAACEQPKPGVLVTRDGDQYLVSLLNCGDPKWARLPVRGFRVGKRSSGAVDAAQCVLHLSGEKSTENTM